MIVMKAIHQIYILFLKEVFLLNTILTSVPSCTERIMSSFPLEIQDRQKTVEETLFNGHLEQKGLHYTLGSVHKGLPFVN